ncbi:30S ribosomal protein S18 [Roseibacillus persicicus]|uniref:30S ribosomal protein S18 n=1 Tax=Roseibacillus persicicus TaxID=454148 RepID=A0A918WKW1_9BACT|nr:30S ribosomal protein S18 [Roseibacillus persicicus]MDQ8192145.1 30S ribosomal protein S18 [Roseibacillus persicicus]GHC52256.1 30S ribosomal protein S18 [Roseibacillus persicicus]
MSVISEPKTVKRRIAFRKANRRMTSKRIDLPLEKVSYLNPEVLAKFTSETGKILPRRVTGVSAKMHRRITREIKRARAVNLLP